MSAPGTDEIKDLLHLWGPFHRGESAAFWMGNLYSCVYRLPVQARGIGLNEKYTETLPVTIRKEDVSRIIDDGIEVQNRNFIQSAELVR